MHSALFALLNRIDSPAVVDSGVIPWGAPVPSFGDSTVATVATLGLNPSNREFVDEHGSELDGPSRRFHTLQSLKLKSWADADARHMEMILKSCCSYFDGNPYDRWFKVLDNVLQAANVSYYDGTFSACHLDLIPYATSLKWAALKTNQRATLLRATADVLGALIRDSPIRVLVLNGRSVVEHFEACAGARLQRKLMDEWTLPRESGKGVVGISYRGLLREIAGVPLRHPLTVLGFNHNLQSSFGVTKVATDAIKQWIARVTKERAFD
jgi:hypothetical protein